MSSSTSSSSSLFSLAWRALLGVVLLIGFYVLAVVLVVGLLLLAYALLRLSVRGALIAFITALTIAWSLIPRREKFVPPGPPLLAADQPRLFAELARIAADAQQTMPHDVFLIPDVNAWVAERGGRIGVGSRRMMGLGLPLLQALTVGQLRAVLAHEYGHYYGGDTRLGPLTYRTYYSIVRTIGQLGKSVVNLPFIWYARVYLMVTGSVSRHQEFVADAFAARLVGARLLRNGLLATERASMAYRAYWQNEVAPVLNSNYLPPLADGFAQFMRSGKVSEAVEVALQKQQSDARTETYDTHPVLGERLAALEALPAGDVPAADPPAISLLGDVRSLETQMLKVAFGDVPIGKLSPIEWQSVGNTIYLPTWRKDLRQHARLLHAVTADTLERAFSDRMKIARKLRTEKAPPLTLDDATKLTSAFLAVALSVLLASQGWSQKYKPGENVSFERDGVTLDPFVLLRDIADGKLTYATWAEQCQALGIAGADLEKAIEAA